MIIGVRRRSRAWGADVVRVAAMFLLALGCSSKVAVPDSLVDRWAAAIGGRPALAEMASIHIEGTIVVQGVSARVDTWETAAGSFRRVTEQDGGIRDVAVRDGQRVWLVDASGSVRAVSAFVLSANNDAAYHDTVMTLLGSPAVAPVSDTEIEVKDGERTLTIVVDRDTGLPRTISHERRTIELSDWRAVGRVKFPFKLRVSYDGREDSVTTIERITPSAAPPETFARPPDPTDTTLATPLVEIPIEIAKNTMYIRASLNGTEERFILDTGAPTFLDNKRAAALGLARVGTVRMTSIRGETDSGFVRGATFQMSGVTLRDLTVQVGDFEAAFGLSDAAGLLGYELFARLLVEIDFARSVIRFGDSTTPRPDRATAIPFTWAETTPLIETTLELADGTQRTAKLMLDTGCACEIFTSRPFATANLRDNTSVAAIRIGSQRIEKPWVVIPSRPGMMDSTTTAGYLGLVFLQRFRVVLDYKAQLLWLEPR
jgi:hypothetical protein